MKRLDCRPPGVTPTAVHIGVGCVDVASLATRDNCMVLLDAGLSRAWPDLLPADVPRLELAAGEASKSFAGLERVLRTALAAGLGRDARLIVVGGGSLGDLGGLAAALYLRGIALTQVPTTLLSMLDSSVGGKTAINLPEGKNLVGALWPATDVWIDPGLLQTLPESELRSGLGEALKMAIGLCPELFELLETRREAVLAGDPETLAEVIAQAVAGKIRVVEVDAGEAGPRRLLNLGHTVGHALEAHSGWSMPHGIAVARGLHWAVSLGRARGLLAQDAAGRCRALLEAYGFDAWAMPPADELLPWILRDKKAEAGGVHAVLPTAVGASETAWMSADELRTACASG